MRELHGWHGDHARDAHTPPDRQVARARDTPGYVAWGALKARMLLDPEARKAARLAYRQKVEAAEAEYAARHAKPQPEDERHGRLPEQSGHQEPRSEHASLEAHDEAASKINVRTKSPLRRRTVTT